MVPVRAETQGAPKTGYRVKAVHVSPSSAKIRGDASATGGLSYIATEKIDVTDRTQTFTYPANLIIPQGVTSETVRVNVTVEIEEDIVKKTFAGVFVQIHSLPVGYAFELNPTTVDITIEGRRDVIEEIERNVEENSDYLEAFIDASWIKEPGSHKMVVNVRGLPEHRAVGQHRSESRHTGAQGKIRHYPEAQAMNLFGTDGIRGVANAELTCEIAFRLGRAMGTYLSPGMDLCVGKDTRVSGDMLEAAIVAGATSTGRNILRLGVITTPGLSFLVKDLGLGGGVMISASHNPAEYNGLKVFGPDGKKIPDETECRFSEFILAQGDAGALPIGPSVGRVLPGEALVIRYAHFLEKAPQERLSGLRVALDTANGATSSIAPGVWRNLGASVTVINDTPDGLNINRECGSTHLDSLVELVRSRKPADSTRFDVGFAYDGDGDRCLVVDENGDVLDGDHIMAILALDMANRGVLSGNTVVGTVMSNYGLEECLRQRDIVLERTPVGDRYVLEKMEERGFKLGGEQSGHIIVRDVLWAGDGILTSLLLADAVVRVGEDRSRNWGA
jgi:phosphoglucosamine mutase